MNQTNTIKETVNRHEEKYQFPSFNEHKSMIGWCSMNYSHVLQNPLLKPKPNSNLLKKSEYNQKFLYQLKPSGQPFEIKRPFQNLIQNNNPFREQGIGKPPPGFKSSTYTLTTTLPQDKAKIYDQTFSKIQKYTNIRPQSCEIGSLEDQQSMTKLKQIGEITYEPKKQPEDIRHLKSLPNSIITEQSLVDILNPRLEYLNLQNHYWISTNLINKIGYRAPNIQELVLAKINITDDILIEIAKSCQLLHSIDVSACPLLTSEGISNFISLKPNLIKFNCSQNASYINDNALENLQNCSQLTEINVAFCNQLTDGYVEMLINSNCKLTDINFSGLKQVTGDPLMNLIENNRKSLLSIDLSILDQKDINDKIMAAIGKCQKLVFLSLTGCANIGNDGLSRFIASAQTYQYGLQDLEVLKLSGLRSVDEYYLQPFLEYTPNLKHLELNGFDQLSEDYIRTALVKFQKLKILEINLTPLISPPFLEEMRGTYKKVKIVRNIIKMTDPTDDGLRMPLLAKEKKKKKAKKKKKKK